MKQTLVVAGASGLFGLNMALQSRDGHRVVGTYWTHAVSADGVESTRVDLSNPDAAHAAVRSFEPDLVVNAAGLTNVEGCEADPAAARRLNVETAAALARAAEACGAQFVHLSTDHLWDGSRPFREEDDAVVPLNVYAQTKWQAEQEVSAIAPTALIVRTNFFGWGTAHRSSFSDWILRGLREGRELTMFDDVYFTPILVNDLIDMIVALTKRGATGVVHVAGGERLSKYEFARRLAAEFGYPAGLLRAATVEGFPFSAKRPPDMSLSCRRAEQLLQRPMPLVAEGLSRLASLGRAGWPATLAAAVTGPVIERGPRA